MRPNFRRTAVAGLALLALVGSGWTANNLVFGGRVQSVPGTPYTLRVQLGVERAQVELVTESLGVAESAFRELLGVRRLEPVTVRLARRTPCIPFSRGLETAVADEDELCVNTGRPSWRYAVREDRGLALSIVAHELFHAVQGQLGCLPGPDAHRYAWWVEGSATYLGWRAVEHAGHVTEADVTREMRSWGGWRPGLGRLESYERGISGDPEYALAQRAVAQLAERSGDPSLTDFCRRVGRGQPWRAAFLTSFGVSVPDFYRAFERGRGAS